MLIPQEVTQINPVSFCENKNIAFCNQSRNPVYNTVARIKLNML